MQLGPVLARERLGRSDEKILRKLNKKREEKEIDTFLGIHMRDLNSTSY